MKKRIFVALQISENLKKKIIKWEEPLINNLPIRWIEGKNLHVTLIPPWYEDNIEKTTESLRHIQGTVNPFEITFHTISYGPPKNPRLIWLAGESPKEIRILNKTLEELLRQKSGKRLFFLHLTLARFKSWDFPSFPISTLQENVNWKQTVNSIVLMESHLSQKGAEYEILARTNL